MPANAELLRRLVPHEHVSPFQQLLRDNPLPRSLKRSVLEEILGKGAEADRLAKHLGFEETPRELTRHEQMTLEAVLGRGSDAGNRELLRALRQSRGEDLVAWADLATAAAHMRVEGFAC